MTAPRLDVLAIGNAIVDVIADADDRFLEEQGLTKGMMRLIDEREAERLYAAMGPGRELSGGSAGNTAAGLAALGCRAGFIGQVADDQLAPSTIRTRQLGRFHRAGAVRCLGYGAQPVWCRGAQGP